MALTITAIPDCAAALGISQYEKAFQIQPGVSDYPTSGYPITAASLGLGNFYGARVLASNRAGDLYVPKFVLPAASFTSSATVPPAASTTINMVVTQADVEISPGVNLNALAWFVKFETQGE